MKGSAACLCYNTSHAVPISHGTSPFQTGLSDHHHLVYYMLKTCFKKEELKHFIYRDYKNFNDINFCMDLENNLEECPKHYEIFEKTIVNVLDAHTPKKTIRGSHKPHVDKNLRKVIMQRSKPKNKANRTKLQDHITKYKKQSKFGC